MRISSVHVTGNVSFSDLVPSSNIVAVPLRVNVDSTDAHVLLFAFMDINVMISQDNTPCSLPVKI